MLKINCACDESERTIKNIYVFANGDRYSGLKVVVNQNRWHHILNQVTSKLDPYFGKVEKLYTTTSGLTVTSFTDLENYATYVASNRFKRYSQVKGGYTVDPERSQEYFEHYLSSQLTRINKTKKLLYVRRDLLVIYIFRNGECGPPFKIVFTSDDLTSWSHILSYIALIIDIPERSVKSLYSLSGNKICGPWELQHGACYVAVGYNESFKTGCYGTKQKSTEVLTTGFPVVPRDKNLICIHKGRRKMQQKFKWNHYEQYTCTSVAKNSSKRSKNTSKKSYSIDEEPRKKSKKVTVHMRIKNSQASNITITRNSGDSSPTHKKKKTWDTPDSSDSENNPPTKGMCTDATCSILSKGKAIKYQSEPASTNTSEQNIRKSPESSPDKKRNLTWKHVKKSESQNTLPKKKSDKITIKVQKGKAMLVSSSDSDDSSRKTQKPIKKEKKYPNKNYETPAIHSKQSSPVKLETYKPERKYLKQLNPEKLETHKHSKQSDPEKLEAPKQDRKCTKPSCNKDLETLKQDRKCAKQSCPKVSESPKQETKCEKQLCPKVLPISKKERKHSKLPSSEKAEACKGKTHLKKQESGSTEAAKTNCTSSCGEKYECRKHKIAKPIKDLYESRFCANTSSNPKPKVKYKNTVYSLDRNGSQSRTKNRTSLIACKQPAKCKDEQKRKLFLKKMSAFLFDSSCSIDSLKGRKTRKNRITKSDSEDSYKYSDEKSVSHRNSCNNSSCSICRIQNERKKYTR